LAKLLSAGSAVRTTDWPILEWLAEALEAQIVGFFVVPALGDLVRKPLPGGLRPKRQCRSEIQTRQVGHHPQQRTAQSTNTLFLHNTENIKHLSELLLTFVSNFRSIIQAIA
jgi:hypothetical protein